MEDKRDIFEKRDLLARLCKHHHCNVSLWVSVDGQRVYAKGLTPEDGNRFVDLLSNFNEVFNNNITIV